MNKHRLIGLALSILLLGGPGISLTACGPPVGPTGPSQAQKANLDFSFQLATPAPEYLQQVQKVEIEIRVRGSASVLKDSFDFSQASGSAEIRRSVENVPTGQVEVKVRLLDSEGKTVNNEVTTSFQHRTEQAAVIVQLNETLALLPPSHLQASGSLSDLRSQNLSLFLEVQSLHAKEVDVRQRLSGIRSSNAPEDKILKEQLQAELQTLQAQIQAKEATMAQLKLEIQRVEAQNVGGDNGTEAQRLAELRLQSQTLRDEIDQLLVQRRRLSGEANSLVSGDTDTARLNQIQAEIETLSQRIDTQITQLETITAELKNIESQLASQAQNKPPAEQIAALEAELTTLNQKISDLEVAVSDLKARIEVLIPKTDMLSQQRLEDARQDLSVKEQELSQAQNRKAEVEARLNVLKSSS